LTFYTILEQSPSYSRLAIGNYYDESQWGIVVEGSGVTQGAITKEVMMNNVDPTAVLVSTKTMTAANANAYFSTALGYTSVHEPITLSLYDNTPIITNQKVDVYFYPDLNVSDPIVNQKADIYFYPDNNISDPVINQEVKIEFYPDGNVTDPDPSAINQEVKIEFYPDGNVTDVVTPVTEDGFKFWFGMKGKKRYGKGFTRKVSF